MTDLEATRLCAEAMGWQSEEWSYFLPPVTPCGVAAYLDEGDRPFNFDPLHDDAQCMALVKRFGLMLEADCIPPQEWCVHYWVESRIKWEQLRDKDLNRAVVYCVAKMQAAKK